MTGFTIAYLIEMGRRKLSANAQLKEAAERQGNVEEVQRLDDDTAVAQNTLSQLQLAQAATGGE
jgi:hypothetical protein